MRTAVCLVLVAACVSVAWTDSNGIPKSKTFHPTVTIGP